MHEPFAKLLKTPLSLNLSFQLYTVATCIKCVMVIQPSQLYFLYSATALIYSDTAVSILIKQSIAHQLAKSRNTTL